MKDRCSIPVGIATQPVAYIRAWYTGLRIQRTVWDANDRCSWRLIVICRADKTDRRSNLTQRSVTWLQSCKKTLDCVFQAGCRTRPSNLALVFFSASLSVSIASVRGILTDLSSVCVLDCPESVLWQNGWIDPDAVWNGEWGRSRDGCIRWGSTCCKGKEEFQGVIRRVYRSCGDESVLLTANEANEQRLDRIRARHETGSNTPTWCHITHM